ncbi:MAG: tetratricopeptide repeat-containing sensor histidine kinase [Ignavibacteriaceae bacterium]
MKTGRYIKYLWVFLFVLINNPNYCQQTAADSLLNILKTTNGPQKVDILNQLSDIYQYIDTKQAIKFAEQGQNLASAINYKKGLADSYGSLGYCYVNLDNLKAINYTQSALAVRTELNDEAGIATSNNVLGVIYYYMGDYLKSIDFHLKALNLREKINDEVRTATSYNNIALVHIAIENYDTALEYLNKALAVRIKTANQRGIAIINDNIGDVQSKKGNYNEAFVHFNKALSINRQIGNKKSEAYSCVNIAEVYRKLGDHVSAIEYYKSALNIYAGLDEKNGIANTENGLAILYFRLNRNEDAIVHARNAFIAARHINSLENIAISAIVLRDCYALLNDYKTAFNYSKIYVDVSDSLKNSGNYKLLAKLDFDYKLEKLNKEKEVEINRQQFFIISLVITLVLTLMIVVLIVFGYVSKRKLNKQLNLLNSQLIDINSAKDRFLSIIAHDLRGPFTGLLGISDILSGDIENLSTQEIKHYHKLLHLSLTKQYELLNDLLEWSRLQNGSIKLNYEYVNINSELVNLLDSLQLTASLKNTKIINNVDKSFVLLTDRNMINLVLRNIISNSIKFTNPNGFVKISSSVNSDFSEIAIEDNGVGISDEDMERLLKIDVHHSTLGTANEMGTGLGLILCKEIIDKHSGSISIKSKIDSGTTVTIKIPQQ